MKLSCGRKHDAGKPRIVKGLLHQFPRACATVARLTEIGAAKYDWDNWRMVPDGEARYLDACGRHLLACADDAIDSESGLHHMASVAWCALLVLEKILEREEADNAQTT